MLPYQKVVGNRKELICNDQLISVTTLLVGLQSTKEQNIMKTALAIRMYTIMALTCSVLRALWQASKICSIYSVFNSTLFPNNYMYLAVLFQV